MQPNRLPSELAPLRDRAPESALFLDYDGTLAPIVADPARALPAPGVPALLTRLAAHLGRVAVVSGRPARFLADSLGRPAGVHLAGLYGMEEIDADGDVREDAEAARWRPVVAEVTARLTEGARSRRAAVGVEPKGLSVTLHWRRAPVSEAWALEAAGAEAARTGLVLQPGRMAVELRPPVDADKGTVVERLAEGFGVVAYAGDDAGDLPAFVVLERLARRGVTVVRLAVADDESPPELAARADLVMATTDDVVEALETLAGSFAPAPEGNPPPLWDGTAR